MATKKETTAGATAAEAKASPAESVYTAAELAENAKAVFKVPKECVAAALKTAHVNSATVPRAREIVAAFLAKEVK